VGKFIARSGWWNRVSVEIAPKRKDEGEGKLRRDTTRLEGQAEFVTSRSHASFFQVVAKISFAFLFFVSFFA